MKKLFFLAGAVLFSQQLCAQDAPIITDRPSFSSGTFTVEKNSVTLESGYQYAFSNSNTSVSTQTLPQLAFRYGLSDTIELDLLWSGLSVSKSQDDSSESSLSDLSIGTKIRLIQNDAYNITLLAFLSLPTGNSSTASDDFNPTLGFVWDYTLTTNISAFGALQATSSLLSDENDKRVYNIQPAIGLSFSHSDKISTFVEYFSDISFKANQRNQHTVDAGVTYLITNDLQWDFNFAVALNTVTDNYIGTGLGYRF